MTNISRHHPSLDAIWLRERVPFPLLFITGIVLPILIYGTIGLISVERYSGAAFITLLGGLPLFFLYTNGTGLKLAWDDNRVYMRPQSFDAPTWRRPWLRRLPWRSLAYDEIVSMDDMTLNDPGARSFLLPFQLLRLTAAGTTNEHDERHIWLYSLALRDKELAPLLRHLDNKCPDMLPEVVRVRLAKWADNDR